MKNTRRLAERIAKLAASETPSPEGRELAPGPDGSALAAILREVDETVLPRTLTFRRGEGRLVLSAGNRRLITVDAAEGPGASAARDMLGRPLTQPDVALLGRLRDALVSALPGGAPIRVRTAAPSARGGNFASGTTAAALASAWGVDLASAAESGSPGPVDDFLGVAPSLSRAWIRLAAGRVTEAGGDATLAGRLRDFADSADMAELDMAQHGDGPSFVAIGRAPDDGDCLVYLSDKADAVLMMIPADGLDAAKTGWRKSVG